MGPLGSFRLRLSAACRQAGDGQAGEAEFRSRRVIIEAVSLGLRPSLNGLVEKKNDDAQKKLEKLE
jgi:hypothetical protein